MNPSILIPLRYIQMGCYSAKSVVKTLHNNEEMYWGKSTL